VNDALTQSRKLMGLALTLGALLLACAIATVVYLTTHDQALNNLFATIGGYIMGIGTSHQGAQMMADRSPNYPLPQPQSTTVAVVTPPGGGAPGSGPSPVAQQAPAPAAQVAAPAPRPMVRAQLLDLAGLAMVSTGMLICLGATVNGFLLTRGGV
jgi:hypothetical protein